MTKQRIQVYVDAETKRRIQLAAGKVNLPVSEYCLRAIRLQLAGDDLLEEARVTIPTAPEKSDDSLIADLRALHDEILANRGGKYLDVSDIIEQVRAERDEELIGLH